MKTINLGILLFLGVAYAAAQQPAEPCEGNILTFAATPAGLTVDLNKAKVSWRLFTQLQDENGQLITTADLHLTKTWTLPCDAQIDRQRLTEFLAFENRKTVVVVATVAPAPKQVNRVKEEVAVVLPPLKQHVAIATVPAPSGFQKIQKVVTKTPLSECKQGVDYNKGMFDLVCKEDVVPAKSSVVTRRAKSKPVLVNWLRAAIIILLVCLVGLVAYAISFHMKSKNWSDPWHENQARHYHASGHFLRLDPDRLPLGAEEDSGEPEPVTFHDEDDPKPFFGRLAGKRHNFENYSADSKLDALDGKLGRAIGEEFELSTSGEWSPEHHPPVVGITSLDKDKEKVRAVLEKMVKQSEYPLGFVLAGTTKDAGIILQHFSFGCAHCISSRHPLKTEAPHGASVVPIRVHA